MSMPAHPSFEDLSAFHDGEAPEWASHVAACAECRSQVDELTALTTLVAGPRSAEIGAESVDPVARALAAAGAAPPAGGPAMPAAPSEAPARVPERPRLQPTPAGVADRSQWMRWMTAASAAAVVLLVAGVLALMTRGGGDGGDTTTALTDRAGDGSAAGQPETLVPGPTGPPDASVGSDIDAAVFGGELGEVADAATLVARAGPDLRAGRDRAAAAPPTTAPPAASGGVRGIAPPTPGVAGTRPCETQARDRSGDLGPVVYYATATRAGTPAVVLGFASTTTTGPVTAQVRAQADCRLLFSAALP